MYREEIRQLLNQMAWIDDITYYHSLRVGNLMAQFVETEDGRSFLKQAWVTRKEAVVAALLHDVGKIYWPPHILLSSLELKEMNKDLLKATWARIIEHPLNSEEIIMQKFAQTGNRFWQRIGEGVVAHHENYNGAGYPYGLKGQEIPLLARGLRVIDSFSVLTYVRRYRHTTLEPDEAIKEMRKELGVRYDPFWGNLILNFLEKARPAKDLDHWLVAELNT